jgi:hypothetical protein
LGAHCVTQSFNAAGLAATEILFERIDDILVQSLKACQNVIINDRHCFELYGYDIIVDEDMHPWLIEVNASPSLAASTKSDQLMKTRVIHDSLDLVAPPEWQRGFLQRPRSATATGTTVCLCFLHALTPKACDVVGNKLTL